MSGRVVHPSASRAFDRLVADLQRIFAGRLDAVVAYGPWVTAPGAPAPDADPPKSALALLADVAFADLAACAERAAAWDAAGLAMPLLLTRQEFVSSLDAFPLEFGDILARHVCCAGADPFDGVQVREEDLRRACELQARSHLIHLREGFLEAGGDPEAVDRLIRGSVPSFTTLLANLARLERQAADTPHDLAGYAAARLDVSAALIERVLRIARPLARDEALQLYPPYHDATAAIAAHADRWKAPARA